MLVVRVWIHKHKVSHRFRGGQYAVEFLLCLRVSKREVVGWGALERAAGEGKDELYALQMNQGRNQAVVTARWVKEGGSSPEVTGVLEAREAAVSRDG